MDEIGQILREARENKGLSLDEVQATIRINTRYLEALETGDYDALPTPVHVRGFLRNYARYLGLDPQPLLDRYNNNQSLWMANGGSNGSISPDNPLPIREDQPFFDPVNMEVEGRGNFSSSSSSSGFNSSGILQIVIIVALLIALGLVANRFIPLILGNGNNENAVAEISAAVQDVIADVTNSTPTPQPTPNIPTEADSGMVAGGSGEQIVSTSRNNPEGAPTITPTRPPLPATLDEIRLKLDILERTWLEVTVDGEVVYSGIAKANDAFEWTAQENAKLVTGNAIGVFATINDVELGRLGGRGERYEESWQTTQQ
ncbi:MAG: DUF4115 domain-containing protein [Chloroflexota bacterium]